MTKQDPPAAGSPAPDFTLPDQEGRPFRLSDHRGRVVALVFYPKDNTMVCTAQMCSIRDRWADYESTGAVVCGVSVGSVDSHRGFAKEHDLPQRLLADESGEVARLYGLRGLFGASQRAVVVIGTDGTIRYRKAVLPIFRTGDDEVIAAIRAAS
jgi:peroxiredoxin Q/BCP